ncbi:regulatory protein RecX [Pectinatus brassicae]|uniref:Regulatory protein RecX n=2 Tax=Pectinatus brassicae TaxID=862415 RepID=A0A840UMJ9_9FIRM|nr:regulatory protein RecX [Pectinatus brassicae]MBB5335908.1 regulatory protein [Pectinatus brassicae]
MILKSNKSALEKAVDYLSIRDYSVKQLRDKLYRCSYDEQEINEALEKLKARHYLDDAQLCARQAQVYLREERYSIKALQFKLLAKGFSSEIVNNCLTADFTEYEKRAVIKILPSRLRKTTDREKNMQYLYRKGFSVASIRYGIDKLLKEE